MTAAAESNICRPLARFVASGLFSAIVYYLATYAAMALGARMAVAGAIGYLVSMPAAFWLHKTFSFRSAAPARTEVASFGVASLMGIAVASFSPGVFIAWGAPVWSALALTCVVTPAINYAVLSGWVFSRGMRIAGDGKPT